VETATISQLKNRLSAYLDKVRAGETVLILDRDRPVARLERVEAGLGTDDRLARPERQGLARRATEPLPMALLRTAAPRAKRSVLDALIEERRRRVQPPRDRRPLAMGGFDQAVGHRAGRGLPWPERGFPFPTCSARKCPSNQVKSGNTPAGDDAARRRCRSSPRWGREAA
jgi:antitoxin (DNA-binding transcriptional repressor) of toxin-antitoxin stability system